MSKIYVVTLVAYVLHRLPQVISVASLAIAGALACNAGLVLAQEPNRVGLVVAHDNQVILQCVEFAEESLSGLELLNRSGLDLNYEEEDGQATICRLDRRGCNAPEQDCRCQCEESVCRFWSYWQVEDDDWEYLDVSPNSHNVGNGAIVGWAWGLRTEGGANPPPRYPLDRICPPGKGAFSKRLELPTIVQFSADRTVINQGESVTLDWEVRDAKQAFLVYDDVRQGIVGEGDDSRTTLAPDKTTTYIILANNDEGEISQQLTITVNPAPPTATPTDTPLPPTATDTPLPLPPTPTDTPLPTATDTLLPPPPTPTDTPMPSPTPLPVVPTFTPLPTISTPTLPSATPARLAARATRRAAPAAAQRAPDAQRQRADDALLIGLALIGLGVSGALLLGLGAAGIFLLQRRRNNLWR